MRVPCEGNPCGFVCQACKAFKQVGICSHVLTINHMMTRFNVRFQLKSIQTNALKKKAGLMGNKRKAPLPALQREPQVAPDSSDEEETPPNPGTGRQRYGATVLGLIWMELEQFSRRRRQQVRGGPSPPDVRVR